MTTMNVHKVDPYLYHRIPGKEEECDGVVWKALPLPGITIYLFPAKIEEEPSDD